MGEITKVALICNGVQGLFELDKKNGLSDAIKNIKKKFNLPPKGDYGLKLAESQHPRYEYYVTDETFDSDVQNARFLEVTESITVKLDIIFKYINDPINSPRSCKELYQIAPDPAFVEKLVEFDKQYELINFIHLNIIDEGLIGCLLVTSELIKSQHIESIEDKTIRKLVSIVSGAKRVSQYALTVLAQILYSKKAIFEYMQLLILDILPVNDLLYFFKLRENFKIQYNALLVLNAFIRKNKDDSRKALINELNTKPNKELFFRMMIEQHITPELANQLAIYQSYLLAAYRHTLSKTVPLQSLDFDIVQTHRMSDDLSMMQFNMGSVENLDVNQHHSMDNISRYSLCSLATRSSYTSDSNSNDSTNMSLLGHHCITYYRDRYNTNFSKSQAEENSYEPGICRSADRVIGIIADVLNFNGKLQKQNKRYVPLYFNPETSMFVEEIFVKMMFMLSQTRKEMRVKKIDDYDKVIEVLRKHLSLIFDRKPKTFKEFKTYMQEITYEDVKKEWNAERANEWKCMVATNPCLIEAYQQIKKENEKVINEHRMGVLRRGELFPMLPEKKFKSRFNKLMVSSNANLIYFGEWNIEEIRFKPNEKQTLYLNQLDHIITGKACPHIKDGTVPETKIDIVFSLYFGDKGVINCIAKNVTTADYWIDGFRIIAGHSERSKSYMNELESISEMDFEMRLVELQNIKLPMQAPPIPPEVDLPDFSKEDDDIVEEKSAPPMIYRKPSRRLNTMSGSDIKPIVPRKANAKNVQSVHF